MQIQCEMELEKETKGTVRYAEKGDPTGHLIGTLYVKKTSFVEGVAYPKSVRVTVESLAEARAEVV